MQTESSLKPHPLQKAAMFGMMSLVLISFSLANIHSVLWISSDWLVSTILPAVVTDATNEARMEEGESPLTRSALLDEAARLKAEDMAQNGYFAHWSPTGVSPWHWFEEAGYTYAHAGENLAVHFTDSGEVVEAWLDSPTHRANILNGNYTEIGIGTAEGRYEGYDTIFVVQMFGTPALAAPVAASVTLPESVSEGETITEEISLPETTPLESVEVEVEPEVTEVVADDTESTVAVTDAGTVVYESYASTENPGVVLAETDSVGKVDSEARFFGRLATSPRLALQIAYSVIGLIVLCLLISALVIEWRRRHLVQTAYSAALIAVMTLLFVVHSIISGGAIIA